MVINITVVVLMAIVLVYFVLLRILKTFENQALAKEALTDEVCLSMIALKRECSEYDIFLKSSGTWQVPKVKIKIDFDNYLTRGELPYYVRDYIRRHRKEVDDSS